MDAATFRTDFPEFKDTAVYPDSQVNLWLSVGTKRLDEARWGELLNIGLELFTAHNLVLGRNSARAGMTGGTPGATKGVITAKAVDKVSSSYDAASVTIDGAGNWNATDYGTRYYEMAMMVGSGGAQI